MSENPLSGNLSLQTAPTSARTLETPQAATARPSAPARGIPGKAPAGSGNPDLLPHGCQCGARWSGGRTAHCPAQCHKTFSGVTGFDAHRRNGQCLNPADLGMSLLPGRAYECWGNTDTEESA